jgi:hypothetical protein
MCCQHDLRTQVSLADRPAHVDYTQYLPYNFEVTQASSLHVLLVRSIETYLRDEWVVKTLTRAVAGKSYIPSAASHGRVHSFIRRFEHQVRQKSVANLGPLVPAKHGVDGFGQLRAAALIDAACIDPCILYSFCFSHLTCFVYLLKALHTRRQMSAVDIVRVRNLLFFPRVR